MNKKFLSAILFGALMATSAGTFVSCKDYDDDINNLQTQIDKNSSAIAELQKLVGSGKWVSSISSIENGFTVTMSDGSSVQIKGINGKDGVDGQDGKNGTVWTIGEDGFWYVDGEKTENVAVAKDGKDGVSAPSPSISADGNWVLYTWDAEKGEFVAEETELSAVGTASYVVEADGVYTLHIADANGEYQEIVLPATCDSFVASNIVDRTRVKVEYAVWKGLNAKDENAAALLKKYPALAELKKNDKVTQGGYLPLMINPANVELNKNFTYSLVDKNGNVCDVALGNPVKGLLGEWTMYDSYIGTGLETRSANAEAGVWTLTVVPGYDAKKYVETSGYAQVNEPAALVVTNAKGVSSRTKLSYTVSTNSIEGLTINVSGSDIPYAEAIDLFEPYTVNDVPYSAPVSFENEYTGYYIIELANEVNVEKYGLSIAEDGHTLNIANMPADASAITVYVNVTAIGLDGTVKKASNQTLTIKQKVAATGNLSAKEVELNGKKQIIKWDIKELGMKAVEMDKVLPLLQAELVYEYLNEEGDVVKEMPNASAVKFYNAQGKSTNYTQGGTWSNGTATEFYIEIAGNDEDLMAPAVYNVTFAAEDNETVLYSAETTLTTTLPELTADYIKLATAFVEEDVLQVTGEVKSTGKVEYDLTEAFILNKVAILKVVDAEYDGNEDEPWNNWIKEGTSTTLSVNTWTYDWEAELESWDAINEWIASKYNQLYTTRKMTAYVYFFGNQKNVATYDFELQVKSTIYSEEPTSVITIDDENLETYFGADALTVTVEKSVFAAGPQRANEYNLWVSEFTGEYTANNNATHANYSAPKKNNTYFINGSGQLIEIAKANYMALGVSAADFAEISNNANAPKLYLQTVDQKVGKSTLYGWSTIIGKVNEYYEWVNPKQNTEGSAEFKEKANLTTAKETVTKLSDKTNLTYNESNQLRRAQETVAEAKKYKDMFDVVVSISGVSFDTVKYTKYTKKTTIVKNSSLVRSITIEAEDADEAQKYAEINATALTIKPLEQSPVDVKDVTLKMYLVIRDNYGMIMKVPFEVAISTEIPEE